jgi:ribosomal protein L11 methyltransferase
MVEYWKITLPCSRAEAEALVGDGLFLSSGDSVPTLVCHEPDPARPDDWLIEIYCDAPPDRAMLAATALLAPKSRSKPSVEQLPDTDWVALSQSQLHPVQAGRFYVHGSQNPPSPNPAVRSLCIDAAQAFGTGHHETTQGCLRLLDGLHRRGQRFGRIADVGTGTGLLAFAAHHLWPAARVLASDIDPVAVAVSERNAAANDIMLGSGPGRVALFAAEGLQHRHYLTHAPFDLIIANILAGPLIALAPAMASAMAPHGQLILAGLIAEQRAEVLRAYRHAGFRLRCEIIENAWPALHLIHAPRPGKRRQRRISSRQRSSNSKGYGEW